MSQSQPAAQEAIQDLLNELAFQRVLLYSIDETVENWEEAKDEVKTEIKALERRMKDLKRSTTSTASNSQPSSVSQRPQQTAPSSSFKSSAMDKTSFQTPKKPNQGTGPLLGVGSASSTASTPNSNMDTFPDITSPAISLPTRKRTHSTHLDGGLAPMIESKSRRTSPSPYMTGPTTPATSSGYDYPLFGDGFFDLTVDDDFPDLDDDFFAKITKDEELRIQREAADAAFAQSLQNGTYHTTSAASPSKGPNAFDRMAGVRPGQSSSSSSTLNNPQPASAAPRRSMPWSAQNSPWGKPVKSQYSNLSDDFDLGSYTGKPNSSTSRVKPEPSSSRIKAEPSSYRVKAEPSSSTSMPGAFIIDDSSNAEDSDIEIIDATEFHDNGRLSRPSTSSTSGYGAPAYTMRRPSFSPESQNAGEAALRRIEQGSTNAALQLAMYGSKQPMPPWMNGPVHGSSLPSMNSSKNFPSGLGYINPAMGMQRANPAGNMMTNPPTGMMPGAYPGINMKTPGPGLGYTEDNLPSYGYNPNYRFGRVQGGPNNLPLGDFIRNRSSQNYGAMTDFLGQPISEAMAGQLDYIMNDPRKTNEEIKELLENIRPDNDLPPEDREGTPAGLKYPLYEHQKLALTWLKAMEDGTNKGGILADDMGLGKTISSLALILSRPSADPARKSTLIVGPVALVRQWDREIQTKVKRSHRLSTKMVHGQGKKVSWDDLRVYDIVLTTYGTLGAELKRYHRYIQEQKDNGNLLEREIDQAPMKKLFPLLGPASRWYRVILDEAQCVKNKLTGSARAACQLKSISRFCLTGTPMMNNVGELYSLIHFLRIKPYNDPTRFKNSFGMLTKGDARQGDIRRGMQKLQAVLKAIMLRRVKTSLIDGKPIIVLPPKTEEIQHVVFTEDEKKFYDSLEGKSKIQFNKYLRANAVGKNYSNILVLLLRLRQCCCHPHLITDFEEAAPALSDEVMVELAKGLSREVIGRLVAANSVFECPVCYDAVTNPSIVIPCGHDTCSECLTQIADRQQQQGVADGEADGGSLKCPCRGKIEMNKIIDYNTFKKVHMADPDDDKIAGESSDDDSSESGFSEDENEDVSDVDSNGNIRGFIVPDTRVLDDDEDQDQNEDQDDFIEDGDGDDEADRPVKRKSKSRDKKTGKCRQKVKKGKRKEKKTSTYAIATLKKEATRSAKGRRKYLKYLRKNWQPSAKVTKCVELLEQFQEEGHKTIVFSQFVSLLDLLQVPIDDKKWVCERYDGAMNADQRNDAINRFTDKPDTKIMLISLKAGNAGLNLVAASRVIILDPFWNPYIEMQAVDRAYRIGQQLPVEVHRILIQGTVEDRIIELQESKKKLVEAALDETGGKSVSRLGQAELAFLFGVGGL